MHTGDRVVGSVCRCMDCARKRAERAMRAALRDHPAAYLRLIDAENYVADLEEQLSNARSSAGAMRADLRKKGLEILLAKDGAQTP